MYTYSQNVRAKRDREGARFKHVGKGKFPAQKYPPNRIKVLIPGKLLCLIT